MCFLQLTLSHTSFIAAYTPFHHFCQTKERNKQVLLETICDFSLPVNIVRHLVLCDAQTDFYHKTLFKKVSRSFQSGPPQGGSN